LIDFHNWGKIAATLRTHFFSAYVDVSRKEGREEVPKKQRNRGNPSKNMQTMENAKPAF